MSTSVTRMQQILELSHEMGVIRAKEAKARGIHPEYLKRVVQQGRLIRSARGVYTFTDADITASHTLVKAVTRVPHGIVCLLSALSFHELTTQAPFEVWLALSPKARTPKRHLRNSNVLW